MYVYVDESGNTGNKIFDANQPLFFTAALMTKTNFDLSWATGVASLARRVNVPALHANELGAAKIEEIAPDLLRIIKKSEARFFVSRVEKKYLAATKVCDTYFDAGENLAVPWQAYWLRQLRLMLAFKLATFVVTDEIAQMVWDCLAASSAKKSKELFIQGANEMLANAPNLPDQGSRELIQQALEWAVANPENFHTFSEDRDSRNMHSPNFVAFSNLMAGVTSVSQAWRREVREVVHDRQEQFQKAFGLYHAMFSHPALAKAEPIPWPGEPQPFTPSVVPGSALRIASEEESPGLQVVDVVLWLFKRTMTGKEIGPGASILLNRVFRTAQQNDLSFATVGASAEDRWSQMIQTPLTPEQIAFAQKFRAESEQQRQVAMREYAEKKRSIESS